MRDSRFSAFRGGGAEGKPEWRGEMGMEGLASQAELLYYIKPLRGSH